MSRKKTKNSRPSVQVATTDSMLNAASVLLANIQFSSIDAPLKVITITSSVPNEGKTTVAISLAAAIGQAGKSCLLVEGDMRRRSLRSALGVRSASGIHALLTGRASIEKSLVDTPLRNVKFLDCEPGIPNPASIINSQQFDKLLDIARDRFDYVVIDTPPVAAFVDAALIARKADATLLVLREDYTDKREAAAAAQQLEKANANIIGAVLNCRSTNSDDYYYGYYYEEKTVPANSPEAQKAMKAEGR